MPLSHFQMTFVIMFEINVCKSHLTIKVLCDKVVIWVTKYTLIKIPVAQI